MKYLILITMFFSDPSYYKGGDAVVIHDMTNKIILFNSLSSCFSYVDKHHVNLEKFALNFFKQIGKHGVVKNIICAENKKET
tara:strand:- start:4461 stop:4706 length:246 start_codon:yes stop_codon:yes gene_type:complete